MFVIDHEGRHRAFVSGEALVGRALDLLIIIRKDNNNIMSNPKYNHAEAYCLMTYRCKDCGFIERFWNSRDGVTPFGCSCQSCGGINMVHVDWNRDQCVPDHIPFSGQGVWIDMPESLKPAFARARLKATQGTDYEVPEQEWPDRIEMIVDSFDEGAPFLIRWK